MKIIITAANGFIGQSLVSHFKYKYEVIALVRKIPLETKGVSYQLWDGENLGDWTLELEGALAVINLAGRSVNCRYNEKNKAEIYNSRLDSTEIIGKAIEQCADKPKVWINAASATIYKHAFEPMTEKAGIIGEGFSVDVCQRWEKKFNDYRQENVRQVILRTAIVLGKDGGVMKPFNNLAAFGLGGKMADGSQMFSWIHEDDLCRAVDFLIANESCAGVYNLAAPNLVTNAEFMQTLREVKKVPFGIPSPAWLLKTGARLIGTETELIFKSRFVVPERLLEAGFEFEHPMIRNCLEDLFRQKDHLGDVEQKWAMTSALGSLIFALLYAGYVSMRDLSITFFLFLFVISYIACFGMSIFSSIPVVLYAYYIRNKARITNKFSRMRRFQLILFAACILVGAAMIGINGIYADPQFFIGYVFMLTIFLLSGFVLWRPKFGK